MTWRDREKTKPSFLAGLRPWCVIAPNSSQASLYLPSLPISFRKSAAEGRLKWVYSTEALAPVVCQLVLESGLCEGVLLQDCDTFTNSSSASIWGRRWQIAARQGGTHLIWIHSKAQATLGIDLKIEWYGLHKFEVKKGQRYFDRETQRIIINPPQPELNQVEQGEIKIEKTEKIAHINREFAKSESSAA